MENKKIFNNINVLKLILVLVIVYYHLICAKMGNIYTQVDLYTNLKPKILYSGYYAVFLFFIICGLFLFKSIESNIFNFTDFVYKKIIRLWPILAFSSLLCLILPILLIHNHPNPQTMILNLFFMHKIVGLSQDVSWNGVAWFVCALFWNSILFYLLRYCIKDKIKFNFVIFLLSSIFFLLFSNNIGDCTTLYFGFVPRELIISFSAMGFGYLIASLLFSNKKYYIKDANLNTFIYSIAEILLLALIILPLVFSTNEIKEPIMYYLLFICLLFILFQNIGIFSKISDSKVLIKFSESSFSIYLMQEVSFFIMQVSFWKTSYPISHPILAFIISFVFCILVGVITHIFVEKPVTKYLTNKYISNALSPGGEFSIMKRLLNGYIYGKGGIYA